MCYSQSFLCDCWKLGDKIPNERLAFGAMERAQLMLFTKPESHHNQKKASVLMPAVRCSSFVMMRARLWLRRPMAPLEVFFDRQ
jgi:hypothetical protein